MSQAKKFGTFAGVFTPSFLSIIGVIMYLRLGWVVGEAGLVNALAIILLAHVISITTGLSISSIATDKKIKTGGIYYMLSRSLGLPMGGAIGITIFIAMSLNIALHLIGFAENFIGVESIRNTFHLGTSINDIRIVGTAAILMLVIIAFISTSLAVKSQFVIFAAIALSLLAIVAGFFFSVDIRPDDVLLQPRPDGLPFETIFAIFFPAATGFTIGVAMSGDLKDPRKSIPKGTMLAILTSMAIYIILAVLFAFMVNRDLLVRDYNFLTNIALWSPLVIAGIWGATLSSGLGGIMGAPRVMQAIANDRMMPRIFGKSVGVNNEPRNALLLTFVIAQMAILIGELNVVARIASMFYMAAYGFINLSYVLESWASPDFRPSFKIPKWVGVVGFVVSFAVMFKLDALAMIIAIVLMFFLYLFLSKKELKLDYGDVWQSVWASIVRSSLIRMARKSIEERNWQPNIILFSGRSDTRPHLIEFGRQMVGSQGLLSNFDLIQIENEASVLPRNKQTLNENQKSNIRGFFSRQHYCSDIYEGIKNISSVYGFSGIEPNTVMLGWGRQSQDPVKFIQTINYIKALDLNILLMDYDKRVGFGKYRQIDIWWRTTEHNGNLGLLLLKFLWLSDAWRNAKARILIVNPYNDQKHLIFSKTSEILENLRIKADIKIINNQTDQRSFYDIVQVESINSDLIFLGLPEVDYGKEKEFVDETNKLCQDIGTVILIKASTTFKELNIGSKHGLIEHTDHIAKISPQKRPSGIDTPGIDFPDKPELSDQLHSLQSKIGILTDKLENENLSLLFSYQDNLLSQFKNEVAKHFDHLSRVIVSLPPTDLQQSVARYNTDLWILLRRMMTDFSEEMEDVQDSLFRNSLVYYRDELGKIITESPLTLKVQATLPSFQMHRGDNLSNRLFKIKLQLRIKFSGKKQLTYNLEYRSILSAFFKANITGLLLELSEEWGDFSSHFLMMNNAMFNDIYEILAAIDSATGAQIDIEKLIEEKKAEALERISQVVNIQNENKSSFTELIIGSAAGLVKQFAGLIGIVQSGYTLRRKFASKSKQPRISSLIAKIPEKMRTNQKLLSDAILLELGLFSMVGKLKTIFGDAEHDIANAFDEHIIRRQIDIRKQILDLSVKIRSNPDLEFNLANIPEIEHTVVMQALFNQLIQNTFNKIKQDSIMLPEKVEIMDSESLGSLHRIQFNHVATQTIFVARQLDYMLQKEFVETVQKSLKEVSEKLLPIKTTTNEIIRSIDFRLNPETDLRNGAKLASGEKEKIFADHLAKLDREIERSQKLKKTVLLMFHERLYTFEDKLNYYSFIQNANHLKDFIRQREIRNRWDFLQNLRKRGKLFAQHQLNQFWYRQSIGVIFSRKLKAQTAAVRFRINDVLAMLEKISIKPEVDEKLPYFYKQLFVRKQYYLNELWTGREKELQEGERAVKRAMSGLHGAILVTGDHHSGKTFFSQYFISKYYPGAKIFTLTPPYAGSTDVTFFKKSLESVFETSGSYYKIFNSLPKNSVLIIDDLALWWEQTEQGFDVVAHLIDLIDKYSRRCLFVVNLNRFSYELMRRINPIENYFLSIIELQPLTARELQEIIMKRHNTTTQKLRMYGRLSEHLRTWDLARLFSKHFSISGGNAGVALQSWLANIEEVKDDTLYIRTPQIPDTSVLGALKPGWYLLIIQLMLHKRANLRKLTRICRGNAQEIKENIDILLRSGLLMEKNPGVYEINTVFYPHIQRKLIEKDMI